MLKCYYLFYLTGCLYCCVVSTHSLDPCLWGESDHPAFGPPASISLHLASNSITPAGFVYKSRGKQCGVYVGAVEEMVCVVCVGVAEGE